MRTESVACGQNSTRVLFSQRQPVGRTCSRLLRPCARPSIRAPQSSGAARGERCVDSRVRGNHRGDGARSGCVAHIF